MEKTPPQPLASGTEITGSIAIVASRYNADFTDALVESAESLLNEHCPDAALRIVRVPGAFEIPLVVEKLARSEPEPPRAIIALGVIIRGATAHADLIAESITHSLHRTSLHHLVPVIHEVLLVDTPEQARHRTRGDAMNRGREAAEAAIEMIRVIDSL